MARCSWAEHSHGSQLIHPRTRLPVHEFGFDSFLQLGRELSTTLAGRPPVARCSLPSSSFVLASLRALQLDLCCATGDKAFKAARGGHVVSEHRG